MLFLVEHYTIKLNIRYYLLLNSAAFHSNSIQYFNFCFLGDNFSTFHLRTFYECLDYCIFIFLVTVLQCCRIW